MHAVGGCEGRVRVVVTPNATAPAAAQRETRQPSNSLRGCMACSDQLTLILIACGWLPAVSDVCWQRSLMMGCNNSRT